MFGGITYATDLFDERTAQSFADRLMRVIAAVVADPAVAVGDIAIGDAAERSVLVDVWSGAGVGSGADGSATLAGGFAGQVARDPGAVAVVFGADRLTYGELGVRANRLARYLIAQGVGPESLVGVALPRSLDVVVAMLAVVQAGAGYVPLDPSYPVERIAYVVGDSAPVCVISWSGCEHEFAGTTVIDIDTLDLSAVSGEPISDAERTALLRPEHVAYVIYTSGSTGRPKGVAVAHRNVVELMAGTEELYGFGAGDVWTMFHSVAFDFSVWELWGPLLTGGRLVVVDYYTSRSPAQFLELVAAEGVTVLNQTPSAFYQFAEADRAHSEGGDGPVGLALRYVIFGGEALEPRRLAGWFDRRGDRDAVLVNMYGITETTVHVTHRRIGATDTTAASVVGGPIAGLRVYVLDSRLRPVPVGVAGEVYIAGGQLSRGYLGRGDLNATRFVADPFGSGGRLYRSGDVARWTVPEGRSAGSAPAAAELEFVGRADDQVKVRGFRIELGEVEAVVASLPGVGECAVVVREDTPGDARLVAYLVPAAGAVLDIEALRTLAGESLPVYMVPTGFVVLERIPLTVNGKLDRKALPAPVVVQSEFRAPVTPIEQVVAGVFAEVLGIDRVGADDDFFALGGNSLLATQVVSRLGAALDASIPVRVLFEAPVVERLAVAVASHTGTGRVALVAGPRPERIPLSMAQTRMWFLNRFNPDSVVDNIPMAIRMSGTLNLDALQAAMFDVLGRHESLRTVYPEIDGIGYQLVLSAEQVGLDLAPVSVTEAELFGAVAGVVGRGFDITTEVPVRARLFRVSDNVGDEFVLVFVAYHIATDGFSVAPLARDVMLAYESRTRGEAPSWLPLPVQYADYALWQRAVLGSDDDAESLISRQIAYWSSQLAGVPDQLDLPSDRPRPAVASGRGANVEFEIPAQLHAGLVELARAHDATLFMVVHAALAVLLARLSGTDDIAVGTPIAGRGERELDDLIGMFVNTLVLRTGVDGGESVADLLAQTRETDLGAFGHADVPFERLVEILDPARSQARNPLFQVALSFQNLGTTRFELPGLTVAALDAVSDTAKFDLQVTLSEHQADPQGGPVGMGAVLTYATDLFDEVSMVEFGRRLVRVFEAFVTDSAVLVGDIEILDAGEVAELIRVPGAGAMPVGLLPELLTASVLSSPDAVAVRFEGRSYSYAELDESSSRLARLLIGRGVGPEAMVALALPRSYAMVLAVWAVAKTGAAYVPVDPTYPVDRVEYMLSDSAALLGITAAAHVDALPGAVQWLVLDAPDTDQALAEFSANPVTDADRVAPVRVSNTAYMIYTSGSTGRPKGVAVTHAGLAGLTQYATGLYGVDADSRFLHVCSPSFDPSVLEWTAAFSNGATLVIVPAGVIGGVELTELLVAERVTHAMIVPAVLGTMDPAELPELVMVQTGGDASTPELVARWAPGRRFFNGYGPTETTIISSYARLDVAAPVTIGAPIPGMSALVLDGRLRPVPVGTAGELYLSGDALARGYHERAGLTADRFVANPYATGGEPMYRTGDLVRWRRDGALEFVGRSDFQVKIRGFRVELGEIDTVLAAHESVRFAVTLGRTLESGATVLVSYVQPVPGTAIDTGVLAGFAGDRLPGHMVPSAFVVIDEVPLTPIGKLDRKALPEPVFETVEFRAATTPLEQGIAEVMAEVLGLGSVSVDDSFFALGGDSIVSIQFVSRARARGIRFTPRDVFEQRTVAGLAEVAVFDDGTAEVVQLPELPGGGVGTLPLTPVMAGFLAGGGDYRTFNQSVPVQVPASMDLKLLTATIATVVDAHDMLRATLHRDENGEWVFEARPVGSVDVAQWIRHYPLPADIDDAELSAVASKATDAALGELDPQTGDMVRFLWFDFAGDSRHGVLYIVGHHFVVDGVSWRILVPDMAIAWSQLSADQPVALAPVATSMRRWTHALAEEAVSPGRAAELELWREVLAVEDPLLGSRALDPNVDIESSTDRVTVEIPTEITGAVLRDLPELYRASVNDALLAALAMAMVAWRRNRGVDLSSALVRMEGHGREETLIPGADLSRTVGWFTSAYPVRADLAGIDVADAFTGGRAAGEAIKAVKEQLLAIPDRGMGYGLLRHFNPEGGVLAGLPQGQVSFNYLGRVAGTEVPVELADIGWGLSGALGALTSHVESTIPVHSVIDINAAVGDDGVLGAGFTFPVGVIDRAEVQDLADLWSQALAALATHSAAPDAGGLTPSDLPLVEVGQTDIDGWEQRYPNLTDVWQLSPLQSGLRFHAMLTADDVAGGVDIYTMQATLHLGGYLDAERLRSAAQALTERYTNLRTAFVTDSAGTAVQLVLGRVDVPWRELDLTDLTETERAEQVRAELTAEQAAGFDMTCPPMMRFTLIRTGHDAWQLGVTVHHILLDGWSMPLLMRDLLVLYAVSGDLSVLPRVRDYRNFLVWLAERNRQHSLDTWAHALDGVAGPTMLESVSRQHTESGTGKVGVHLSEAETARLTEAAAALGVTLNTMVQAAWAILLGRMTGSSDVVFGATVSGRPADIAGVESMVGLFINTIPVRVRIAADATFSALLGRLQSEQADLLEHHYLGLTDIHHAAGVAELFNTLFVFESYPIDRAALSEAGSALDGMAVTGVDILDGSHYPLTLLVNLGAQLVVDFKYDLALFATTEIETLAARLLRVLARVAANAEVPVGDIDILDAAERDAVLSQWNATDVGVFDGLLLDRFDRAVAATPDAVAVVFEGDSLTYADFAARVNRLARHLMSLGVGPESRVAVAMRRGTDLLAAIYAVTAAGGAYVPVDPDHPADRIAYVLDSADPVVVLTTQRAGVDAGDRSVVAVDTLDVSGYSADPVTDADRVAPLRAGNTAYVIYTSGSTGRPKGVAVTHGAIVNRLEWMQTAYALDGSDVVLWKTPVTFDVSVWELFWALGVGARLVVAAPDGHRDPVYLAGLIAEQSVTTLHFVPSMMAAFVGAVAAGSCPSVRRVFASGEALTGDVAQRLRTVVPSTGLHNLYGPTEAAVDVTFHEVTDADTVSVPIGAPVFNTEVFVLDARLRPVPVGVPGELYLAGVQLARGYLGRADLTADRFVTNPYGEAGERMYRTGDLVRWTPVGELDYLGRTDFQVKLRGLRIELGEIEAALLAFDGVTQSVVVVRGDGITDRLVGYVVGDAASDPEQIRAFVAARVPSYMVPEQIMILDSFPLNASGKLDRKALPAPVFEVAVFRAPTTSIEQAVAGVFAEVLGIDRVGLDDDFFALGGNSLLAMQVVSRLGAALDATVPVRALFDASTVERLAVAAESHAGAGRVALVPQVRPEQVPLSLAQSRMWFLNRLNPDSAVDNIPAVLRITGPVDTDALQRAVTDLVERQETLRTIYPEVDGVGHQVVLPSADATPDVTPVEVDPARAIDAVREFLLRGFDVTRETPFRVALFRLATDEHLLAVVMHHISGDGASVGPLARDVMVSYEARARGAEPGWAPLPVQYADFALWQREVLGSEDDPESVISQQLSYWTRELAGLPEEISLPADRPRPHVASFAGAEVGFDIDADLGARVEELGRRLNATPFMVVHAALAVVLSRLSGTDDIAIGTPVAGRGERELDDMVGMFVNTLVLRTGVDGGESFADLLARARDTDLGAFGNADVPFERLVEIIDPIRSQARNPLFQVMLAFQNFEQTRFEIAGLTIEGVENPTDTAKFDLLVTLGADPGGAGYGGTLTYATDLFDEATVAGFGQRLVRVLEAVTADPSVAVGDVELLTAAERALVVSEWNATDVGAFDGLVLDRFEQTVATSPDEVAVVFEGEELTYAQFAARVHRLARHLISIGVGPESRVAVAMRRGPDLLTGIYAVVAAGGAYVPVDPDHPADRTAYVLESADPVVVLTTTDDGDDVRERSVTGAEPAERPLLCLDTLDVSGYSPDPVTDADRLSPLRPGNAAYVIYTSGSTGRPKGVAVAHRSVVNQIGWVAGEYGVNALDVVLWKTPTTFDVSVWELFAVNGVGGRLVAAAADGHRDPAYLVRVIEEQSVTLTSFVPSMLSAFVTEFTAGSCASLRAVFVAGEALPAQTVSAFRARSRAEVHNLYGPTEFTVHATAAPAPAVLGAFVPIGAPVYNSRAFVLDARLRPVAPGVAGELYMAGVQVARGYFGRPDLSAERFVANPFGGGGRLYRTGDLVRWTTDSSGAGVIEYLGRTDFQVKLRGQRIELGEIEAALLAVEGVAQSVVVVHNDGVTDRLVGYVTAYTTVDADAVRRAVSERVPSYMVPTQIIALAALPLNPSGKLDRKALPAPVFEAAAFRAPTTTIEQAVADVFAEVLGLDRVGLDDDFFALGGNSLLGMQVMSRLGQVLDATIPVRVLFEASAVERLAVAVQAHAGAGRVALVAGPRPESVPLSLAQSRMWFLNRLDPESAAYNMPMAIRLTGELDTVALQLAVGDVVARHESLRTVYPEVDGIGFQQVLPPAEAGVALSSASVRESEVFAEIAGFAGRGFDDLTERVPVRARLFRITDVTDEFVLVVVVHHIATDGFSVGPLARDVMMAYESRTRGEAPGWTPLPVQYADFALWQREVLGSEDDPESLIAGQLDYWTTQLAGVPDELALPLDRPRPAVASGRGATVGFEVPAQLHAGLVDLAREHEATLFMVVHTALAVLLARLSGGDDVAIGTPIAGRGERELDDLIGMFVNTLVLRTPVEGGASVDEVLTQARATDVAAFGHADVPFERLVEVLDPARSQARHPLFQVALSFQNHVESRFELPGLTVAGLDAGVDTAKFDLQVTVSELGAGGMSGALTYATDLFDEVSMVEFGRRLVRVFEAFVTDSAALVGDIEILDAGEVAELIRVPGAGAMPVGLLPELLTAAVLSSPAAVAVRFEGRSYSYAELDESSSRLARLLIGRGVGPEAIVALALPRSYAMVLAVWAVAKTGAAYVPVDPTYPVDRVEYMLSDSAALLGVTGSEYVDGLPDGVQWLVLDAPDTDQALAGFSADAVTDADRLASVRVSNTAYMIYTSGSTGRPKGVAVTHAGLAGLTAYATGLYGVDADSRFLHVCSPSFDPSVLEWTAAFSNGATLVIVPAGVIGGVELTELLAAERVTHAIVTPAVLGTMDPAELPELVMVQTGGDVCTPELVARWAPGRRFFNGYGPTETTIISSYARLDAAGPVTIGAPIPGMSALVLDARLRPVPVGTAGELYLCGDALARGYQERAGLTADRFVANPYATGGEPMYRTGDLVRWRRDGALEFVGRSDFQVKIRGFRVELGEIDAVLASHESVRFAVTLGSQLESGATVLVSYVQPAPGVVIDTAVLAGFAGDRLPGHMVPSAFVVIDEVPLTPIGKLDRKALPEPVFETVEFRAATTPLEQGIAEVMAEVLGLGSVSVDDSFFALGGDSIVSIQFVSRARARGIRFTPRDVFEQRTVAGLAEVAVFDDGTAEVVQLPELPGGGVGTLPLTPVMAGFLAGGGDYRTFNQSVPVQVPASMDAELLRATIASVVDQHDMLRATLHRDENGEWVFEARPVGSVDVAQWIRHYPLPADIDDAELNAVASAATDAALGELDPQTGDMVRFLWFDFGADRHGILYIVGHHFVVDGVSWRILVPDMAIAWAQLSAGQPVALAPVATSMRRWTHALAEEAVAAGRSAELELWRDLLDVSDPLLGSRSLDPVVDVGSTVDQVTVEIPAEVTGAVLRDLPELYRASVNDALLAGLAMAMVAWRRNRGVDLSSALVRMEGHGREETLIPGADLSRTVGWFTSAYPVRTDLAGIDIADAFNGGAAAGEAIKAVKEQLLAIPDRGMGYGLLRQFNPEGGVLAELPQGQVSFNYLGRVGGTEVPAELADIGWGLSGALGALTSQVESTIPVHSVIDINAAVGDDGVLGAGFSFPRGVIDRADVAELADLWSDALRGLAQHSAAPVAGGLTPSDLPLVEVGQTDIDGWEQRYPNLTDVWQLSPLQSGLRFHAMLTADGGADIYTMQATLHLGGYLDAERLRSAAQALTERYTNLRTAFVTDSAGTAVQLVLGRVDVPWREVDLTGVAEGDRAERARRTLAADQANGFDMTRPPLLRFTLVRTAHDAWQLGVTVHHILLDGWSMPLLMRDLLVLYAVSGDLSVLPRVRDYRNFLVWLAGQDRQRSLDTWAHALDGVAGPTMLESVSRQHTESGIDRVSIEFSEADTARLTEAAGKLGVTINTMVQAAWAILLGRMTGQSDVVFGATVSGRPADLAGVESMVGLFINTIPVRVRIAGDATVSELLSRLQSEQADLLEHHYVGLPEIHQAAGVGELFNTLVVFESYPIDQAALSEAGSALDGMQVNSVEVLDGSHYPLGLLATVAGAQLDLGLKYDMAVFDTTEIETLADRLRRILDTFVRDVDGRVRDIELVDEGDLDALGAAGAGIAAGAPPVAMTASDTLPAMLAEIVEQDPAAPALVRGDEEVSYAELDGRSSRLARELIGRGAGPGDVVAVVLSRSEAAVEALWAVAKTGATFLLLDPTRDAEALRDAVTVSGASVVVTIAKFAPIAQDPLHLVIDDPATTQQIAAQDDRPVSYAHRRAQLTAEHAVFVTSAPSAHTVTHGELAPFLGAAAGVYGLDAESRTFLYRADERFQVLEVLLAATTGAAMVLAEADSAKEVGDIFADDWVTHGFVAAGVLAELGDDIAEDLSDVVLTAGAAADVPDLPDEVRLHVTKKEWWT
ncbi:non-ribosomal peptide synthase/polyketide synthase [Aldersonia sp. NBC_00410]|uniref:non-ribosomal peptide synthase/polyketide synthase n=1 Tax=Aldersonia sp. NBC_00410 TaxID=2975954 RepID=UPI002251C10D|nr:non-ribosomal peptide synthase/polyketide synthase [Aldersonia sp. NBC_00410]MCX5046721.1 non-ribosomal peptide synthase/polyketide synthase [Aldersonia sp. NBC_00410]